MKRLLFAALTAWILRWALLEVAAYAARRWVPEHQAPEGSRAPGRMPGPLD